MRKVALPERAESAYYAVTYTYRLRWNDVVYEPGELKAVAYKDGRQITIDGRTVNVPSRATFTDERGRDTLRVALDIEDAIGTDVHRHPQGLSGVAAPYFIQMKGIARIAGRIDGAPVEGTGTGFFETYR